MTVEQAYLYFGIANPSTIHQWLKSFQQCGIEGLHPKPKGRPAMKKNTLCQNATATENRRRALTLKNSRIRNGECLPKKVSAIRPRKNEEKANAVQELRPDYPLDLLLRYANLARSTFFYHLHGKDKTRDDNASLCAQILAIKQQNPHYGYRRVTKQLGEGSNINGYND
ncbi:hypothetical protein CF595_11355 [Gallibacterium anatis]|nr:helix-turn-helix domain-containing protein [Gallibacterium anatis]OZN48236.1 hypothetical protein CF595_11355 [Gallibacterium anatis]